MGWCAGEAVDPKYFMQPEPKPAPKAKPAPKPKPKAEPVKKKKDKKKKKVDPKFENTGKIMANRKLKKKGDSQKPTPVSKVSTFGPKSSDLKSFQILVSNAKRAKKKRNSRSRT